VSELEREKARLRDEAIEEAATELDIRVRGLRVLGELKQADEAEVCAMTVRALKGKPA
jgi:hypothetical protein